jgi:hypothetical protein
MPTLCSTYEAPQPYSDTICCNMEDDYPTGTTFTRSLKSTKTALPYLSLELFLIGSSIILIDFDNLNNNFMKVPIYTRFKTKETAIAKPVLVSRVAEPETEFMEFSFKPFPINSYKIKIKISSVNKGTHKFQPLNDYL